MRLFGYALLQRSRWSESAGLRPRAPIRVRPLSRSRLASADLFSQGDDDARGAAEVTQQEDALVLCHPPRSSAPWARRRATVSWMSMPAPEGRTTGRGNAVRVCP